MGNGENSLRRFGKAGAKRWRGSGQPSASGNEPIDHPHGGGEGKTAAQGSRKSMGNAYERLQNRRNKRTSGMIIVDRRKRKG